MSLSFSLKLNTRTFHQLAIRMKIIKKYFLFIAAIYDGRIFQWIEFRFIKYFYEKNTQGFTRFLSLFHFFLQKEKGYMSNKKKVMNCKFFIPSPATAIFHSFALRDFKNKFYVLLSFILIYPLPDYPLSVFLFTSKSSGDYVGSFSSQCSFFFFAFKITNSLFLLPYKNRSFFLLIFLSHSIAVIL